jgi:hypothetical protein
MDSIDDGASLQELGRIQLLSSISNTQTLCIGAWRCVSYIVRVVYLMK